MALYRSIGAALEDDNSGTNPIDVRKDLGGLFIRAGILPGSTSPLVAGTAAWAYSLAAGSWVTQTATGDGYHLWGNDGAVTVGTSGVGGTVPAAPGSGLSRIDIIWIRHPSNGENGDTTSAPFAGVTCGTAASSPTAPALPAGAFELARNTMTSAATSTASTGNTIAQTAPSTAAAGGGIRRLVAPAVVSANQGPVSTTESQVLTSGSTQVRSPGGQVRLTLRMIVSGTVANDSFRFRVRDGSVAGTELTSMYVTITNTTHTSALHIDSVAISAGVARTLYVTVQRSLGTGSITILPATTLIVDEDPA